jgi:hypothetical protein
MPVKVGMASMGTPSRAWALLLGAGPSGKPALGRAGPVRGLS